MPTVEIRADYSGVPHSFLVIKGPNGEEYGYGFSPVETGLYGDGQVTDDLNHEYDISSGEIAITTEQYNSLINNINESAQNPPYYALPYGAQCSAWALNMLSKSEIISPVLSPNMEPDNIVVDFIETIIWNPYTQAIGFTIYNLVNDWYLDALNWILRRDPLTLDLDGDGIETLPADGSILFDHNGDGIKSGTGWVAPDDGLLVLDKDGNGLIETGNELFGDNTVKADGSLALNGFDALADLDSNADNRIDSNDAQFADLRIWRDLSSDRGKVNAFLFR